MVAGGDVANFVYDAAVCDKHWRDTALPVQVDCFLQAGSDPGPEVVEGFSPGDAAIGVIEVGLKLGLGLGVAGFARKVPDIQGPKSLGLVNRTALGLGNDLGGFSGPLFVGAEYVRNRNVGEQLGDGMGLFDPYIIERRVGVPTKTVLMIEYGATVSDYETGYVGVFKLHFSSSLPPQKYLFSYEFPLA